MITTVDKVNFSIPEEVEQTIVRRFQVIQCIPFISQVSMAVDLIGKHIIGHYTPDCINKTHLLDHVHNKSYTLSVSSGSFCIK